ncbi:MAG: PilZ domain-containing protein [Acidobacteria bacterium]|nr:PilZ domain-containing protein [Acidobacteriota bacterium]
MPKAASGDLRPRRYQLFLPLKVWVRSWGRGEQAKSAKPQLEEETITENISSAGCYFLLEEEPEIGSRVEMEIKMEPKPGGKPGSKVICRGRIVRTEKEMKGGKTGVGCAFERYRIIPPSKKF